MQDDQPISDKTRKVLEENNIPEGEMTGSELRDLNERVSDGSE